MDRPVVVVESDNHVVLRSSSGDPRRGVLARSGFWPMWNPQGDCLAMATVEGEGTVVSTLQLVDVTGQVVRELHRSPANAQPVIAARVPNYAIWSPGGERIAIVGTSAHGLTLFLSHRDGSIVSDPLMNGAPLFPVWSGDGRYLAVHSATELVVIDTADQNRTHILPERATGFRAPAYSPDGGNLVFALAAEEGVRVVAAHADGSQPRDVASFAGGVALAFRPGTSVLTVALTRSPDTGNFDELWSIDLGDSSGAKTLLARGPFVAFSWSPTGERMVLVVPSQTGDGRYALQSRLADGRSISATEPIVPSLDYRMALGFFDQYARSHSTWSDDGELFLIAGRFAGDAVSAAFGDPVGDYVFGWSTERGAPLRRIAPGQLGFVRPTTTNEGQA